MLVRSHPKLCFKVDGWVAVLLDAEVAHAQLGADGCITVLRCSDAQRVTSKRRSNLHIELCTSTTLGQVMPL